MGLGTKNRQKQTADLCKEHLRITYPEHLVLIDDFIQEIEGVGKEQDVSSWGQFTDLSRNTDAMLKCLDEVFMKWLLGGDVVFRVASTIHSSHPPLRVPRFPE